MKQRQLFIKIRLYCAILGVFILYSAIHEFAYRKYKQRETPETDSTSIAGDTRTPANH